MRTRGCDRELRHDDGRASQSKLRRPRTAPFKTCAFKTRYSGKSREIAFVLHCERSLSQPKFGRRAPSKCSGA